MHSYLTTYYVCYRKITKDKVFDDIKCLSHFKKIKNPFFYWAADPFLVTIDNRTFILAELASKITGKGHIGYCELGNKKCSWKPLYKSKKHLSFPNFVFDKNKYVGIIETSEDEKVSLFNLNIENTKPESITVNKILIDDRFVVDSVFNIDNDFLLTYKCDYTNNLFYLTARKLSHPEIEVNRLNDTKKQYRPAGNILIENNTFILPTQDCYNSYGEGINFNYLTFSSDSFSLIPFCKITKEDIMRYTKLKNIIGCHTYNTDGTYEVIDIIRKEHGILCPFNKIYCVLKYIRSRLWKKGSK